MLSIYLKITRRCDIRCGHCFINDYSGDMGLDVVTRVGQVFPGASILFHGGEPTLMGTEYVRKAIGILGDRKYVLQSNMIDFSAQDWIPILREHFNSSVGTSLDSSRSPYISKWLENVRVAADCGIRVTAVVTITRDLTLDVLRSLINLFQTAGGKAFRLQFVSPVKTAPVPNEQYMSFIKAFYAHPLNENRQRLSDAVCSGAINGVNGGNCGGKVRTIEPDGTVYVCPDLAGQGLFPLGNVLTDDARKLARQNSMFCERELKLAVQCEEECWRVCRGGCLTAAFFQAGDYTAKDPYCASYKTMIAYTKSVKGEVTSCFL